MPKVRSNGIEIEHEVMGDGDPLVLIMGLGAQLVHWPDRFCEQLAERGFTVVRFDNRDCGLSTRLDNARVPNVRRALVRHVLGLPIHAPYTLEDMADDTVGLLDALGIERAHVLGVSMGGMIGQTMAIRHPEHLRSLTSVMSTTGARRHTFAKPRAVRALLQPPPKSREQAMDRAEEFFRTVGSPAFDLDIEDLRVRAGRAWDRGINPRGFARQLAAILASGSRERALRRVRTPTLVIHGTDDPLILPAAGRATARCIRDAELRMVQGMGHDLREGIWPVVYDGLERLRRR